MLIPKCVAKSEDWYCYMIMLFIISSHTANGTNVMPDIRYISLHVLTSDLELTVIIILEAASGKPVISSSVISICPRKAIILGHAIILELIFSACVISLA